MTASSSFAGSSATPRVTRVQVIPVAGHDSMLLNLSGAHGPFFTRNLLVLTDSLGHVGVGEVPGGEKIRKTLEDAGALIEGQSIGNWNQTLNTLKPSTPAPHHSLWPVLRQRGHAGRNWWIGPLQARAPTDPCLWPDRGFARNGTFSCCVTLFWQAGLRQNASPGPWVT